jgi:negative regulator of sigma E activity
MNDESLSAMLDGECTPSEQASVLGALNRDPGLRRRLSRLTLVGESLRGVRVRTPDLDFADRVMAGLGQDQAPAATVRPSVPHRRSRWRPVVGLAAAAGVVGLAVLALKPRQPAAPAATAPAAATEAAAPAGAAQQWARLDDDRRQQLRNYLFAYSQARAQQGMGTLGYARYAAYTDSRADSPAATPDSGR